MPFESNYYNLQLKIAHFLKFFLSKGNEEQVFLKKKYFIDGIRINKSNIEKKINEAISKDENNSIVNLTDETLRFKDKVNFLIENGKFKIDESEIKGETSYNIVNQYRFRHLVYYEYIMPIQNLIV